LPAEKVWFSKSSLTVNGSADVAGLVTLSEARLASQVKWVGRVGPLALREILLAGCPVVGVRTGAPLVRQGNESTIVRL
jgi:hypothetical protein